MTFLIMLTMIQLVNAGFYIKNAGTLCSYRHGTLACSILSAKDLLRFNFTDENQICGLTSCELCVIARKSFIVTENNELKAYGAIHMNLTKARHGKDKIITCKKQGLDCNCYQNPCNGTNDFCKNFECKESNCICKLEPAVQIWNLIEEGHSFLNIKTLNVYECLVRTTETVRLRKLTAVEEKEDKMTSGVVFKKDKTKIVYSDSIFTVNKPGLLILRAGGFESIVNLKDGKLQTPVPVSFLRDTEQLEFHFIDLNGTTLTGTVRSNEHDMCRRVTCTVCLDAFRHISCLPTAVAYTLYCIIGIISGLAFLYLRMIVTTTYQLIKLIYTVAKQLLRCGKNVGRASLITGAALGNRTRQMSERMRQYIDERLNLPHANDINIPLVTMALLMTITTIQADCTSNNFLSTEAMHCREDINSEKICDLHTHTQITLNNIGFTSCLYIESSEGEQLMSLTLKLEQVTCTFTSVRQYYTFPAKLSVTSANYCPSENFCGWGTHCINDKNVPGLSVESQDYPGILKCVGITNSPRCWIVDSNSCLFYKAYLKPSLKQVYEVKKLTSYSCAYELAVTETNLNSTEHLTVHGQAKTRNGIKISIPGALNQPPLMLNSAAAITRVGNPRETYLESASNTGQPISGTIGQLQANESFTNHFIFDPTSIQCSSYEDQINCLYQNSYLETLIENPNRRLPKTIGFHYLNMDKDGVLHSKLLSSAPVLVNLRLQNYKIKLRESHVCPAFVSGSHVSVTGCYNCEKLAKLTLSAYSACEKGIVHISAKKLKWITPVINLDTVPKEYTVTFTSETKCLSDRICLQTIETVKCKDISVCLDEPDIQLSLYNHSVINGINPNTENWTNWTEWFNPLNLISFLGFPKLLLYGSITIILIIFCFSAIITCIKR